MDLHARSGEILCDRAVTTGPPENVLRTRAASHSEGGPGDSARSLPSRPTGVDLSPNGLHYTRRRALSQPLTKPAQSFSARRALYFLGLGG